MSARVAGTLALMLALAGCQAPAARLAVAPAAAPAPVRPAVRPLSPDAPELPAYVPDQVVVGLVQGVTPAAFMALPALAGFELRRSLRLGGRHVLKVGLPDAMTPTQARERLGGLAEVERVSEDWVPRTSAFTFTSPDPRLGEQWYHDAAYANTRGAWDAVDGVDQNKVIVAILDTGLDVGHPEFAGRIVGARNFTTGGAPDTNVSDAEGHGTHVAGIAAAAGNNGHGVAGVAWGVKVMPVKVLGGQASTFDVIDGLLYAARFASGDASRVRVINMSLGVPSASVSGFFAQAIAEARDAGILVVGAAGNDGREGPNSPSSTPHCLAVGATTRYLGWEMLAGFSNYGEGLALSAPGERILSTLPTGGSAMGTTYGLADGTSMAAPYVAGVAALLAAKYDGTHTRADAAFVDVARARLLASVDDLGAPGPDPLHGAGRLNASKALTPASLE